MQQCKQLLPLPSLSHSVFTVSPVSETPGSSGQAADKLPSGSGASCQVIVSLHINIETIELAISEMPPVSLTKRVQVRVVMNTRFHSY